MLVESELREMSVFALEGRVRGGPESEDWTTWLRVMKALEISADVCFLSSVPWSSTSSAGTLLALPLSGLVLRLITPASANSHRLPRSLLGRFERQTRRWKSDGEEPYEGEENEEVEEVEEPEDPEETDADIALFAARGGKRADFAAVLARRRERREMRDPLLISPRNASRFEGERVDVVVKIVDFGNACYANDKFTDEIQTRQYRAPEVCVPESGHKGRGELTTTRPPLLVITHRSSFEPTTMRARTCGRSRASSSSSSRVISSSIRARRKSTRATRTISRSWPS